MNSNPASAWGSARETTANLATAGRPAPGSPGLTFKPRAETGTAVRAFNVAPELGRMSAKRTRHILRVFLVTAVSWSMLVIYALLAIAV